LATHPAVDQEVFQNLIESLGHEMLSGIVIDFGRDAQKWLKKMKDGVDAADAERIQFSIHGLRSASVTIGALELGRLTRLRACEFALADYLHAVVDLLAVGLFEVERFQKDAFLMIWTDKFQVGECEPPPGNERF
jgi:hypothetical protein